ncbi:MAG: helix-turn-helix transcriptional regulator [Clostridia bacterium]|nr:helix-turn-helix transcriptional regulator [Clostridia bacterium]
MKSFGEILKELRKLNSLTQKDVATALQISETCYAGYEQGYREPNLETLRKIVLFFNVSADEILGLDDKDEKEIILKTIIK